VLWVRLYASHVTESGNKHWHPPIYFTNAMCDGKRWLIGRCADAQIADDGP